MSNQKDSNKPVQRKNNAIYALPNLITTASMLCGFSAILMALDAYYGAYGGADMPQSFTKAAILVFIAMIFDGLDGRVARMTNSASAFGEQYDSLSDLISFGIAPALIIYLWALKESHFNMIGGLSWVVAYIYLACAALRLARFNVQIGKVDKRFFVGMPSPTAAAIVVGFVWFGENIGLDSPWKDYIALVLTLYSGLMMVTNIKFFSFKDIRFQNPVPFFYWVLLVILLGILAVCIVRFPGQAIFLILLAYGLSGPIYAVMRFRKRRELQSRVKDRATRRAHRTAKSATATDSAEIKETAVELTATDERSTQEEIASHSETTSQDK
ncbi:CDP-diacylglycerol--serine O-phosphatidyltransferase [Ignatzschineria larvae DSM 13226]|uniref:CDP-diacylglycerol--serine O-phosphatidyltransferase n=1 Tax=Ignatzschineria larvae DSM 13226 TaxID=1111732 RepID=A0ABZ3C1R8_9GAMM|nr:CDP-diacylglycerol--serine O-phosphatidyltransferase [Ignatzschineria larvae]